MTTLSEEPKADTPSEAGLDAVVKAILGSNADISVSKALNTFSSISNYLTGNEKWYDSMVQWIAEHIVDDASGKKMFKDDAGNVDLTAARAFLESIKNQKQMSKQLKWRVPSVYQRIKAAEQNKVINPMLIRGLTNSSSNMYNKVFA